MRLNDDIVFYIDEIMSLNGESDVLPPHLRCEERLNVKQVTAMTGWSRSKILDAEKAGSFPPAERRGQRCTRWRTGDLLDWLRATATQNSSPVPGRAQ
jgi:predicted DNA-binding transcriptional regulator AlpA